MVALVLLAQNFGPVVWTYDGPLPFCECRWHGDSTWRWWGQLNTTCQGHRCRRLGHVKVAGHKGARAGGVRAGRQEGGRMQGQEVAREGGHKDRRAQGPKGMMTQF